MFLIDGGGSQHSKPLQRNSTTPFAILFQAVLFGKIFKEKKEQRGWIILYLWFWILFQSFSFLLKIIHAIIVKKENYIPLAFNNNETNLKIIFYL